MTTHCDQIREQLGAWIDGELSEANAAAVEAHLRACEACQACADALRRMAAALESARESAGPTDVVREAIWRPIDATLSAERRSAPGPSHEPRRRWGLLRPLAAAAMVLIAIGLGTYSFTATNGPAIAAEIDLRPFLEQSGRDISAGLQALMDRYGGRELAPDELASAVRLRVHVPDKLPLGMKLESAYLLHMGHHHKAAALLLRGRAGQLLLIQCPGGTKKELGNVQCVACRLGGRTGHLAEVGPLQIAHLESPNVCVCVVSALPSRDDLSRVLEKVQIDFRSP